MISRDTNNLHTVKIDTKITTQSTAGARNLDLKSKYSFLYNLQWGSLQNDNLNKSRMLIKVQYNFVVPYEIFYLIMNNMITRDDIFMLAWQCQFSSSSAQLGTT